MRLLYLFVALAALTAGAAFGQGYAWFVNEEPRPYGTDGDYQPFGDADTTYDWLHSNGQIAIAGAPVFYGRVFTHASSFIEGPGYNPQFLDQPPVFNALLLDVPDIAYNLRAHANHYENPGPNWQQRLVITGSTAHVYTWNLGEAFDSLTAYPTDFPITGNTCFFTEAPLELMGTNITGRITIGSARQIRLMDDVRVGGPTSGPPQYRVQYGNPNYVGIVSEGNIKIAKTPANGQENSGGLGYAQPDPSLTDIVITAAVVALGSFEFENQNDPDSGYVCDCSPDERGDIYLWGSLTQGERGYLSRTNNGFTGYHLRLRHDERFNETLPPCFSTCIDTTGGDLCNTDTVDFGDVPVDSTVWDTAHFHVDAYSALSSAVASLPFHALRVPPFYGYDFIVPVWFRPDHAGNFTGVMQVVTSYRFYQIPIRARGVSGGGPNITEPGAYPNPFNSSAAITFEVTAAGQATLEIFDVTGCRVMTAFDQHVEPGTQHVIVNGESLSTGIYFARLRTPSQERTLKLMLIK